MASTNKTSNLELSQFIATDTPTWLVDYNGDMEKIDAGVGRVEELAQTASTQAVGVASGLQATNQTVTTLSGQVANVQNQANTTTASVNGINQRLGNSDISGIGDGTITGAIIAQNGNLSNLIKNKTITTDTSAVTSDIPLSKPIVSCKCDYNSVPLVAFPTNRGGANWAVDVKKADNMSLNDISTTITVTYLDI